jgi:hypothetical protein
MILTWLISFHKVGLQYNDPVKYHLVHVVPQPQMHGLFGYSEVIETVRWGLTELGHDVSVKLNGFSPDRPNIVFGAQMLDPRIFPQLTSKVIVYNFEQIARYPVEKISPTMRYIAHHLPVWDYSQQNMETWRRLNPSCNLNFVPIGFSPTLKRIPKAQLEDIDVLFYGITGPLRLQIFDALCRADVRTVYACGLYGDSRDNLIGRAKLVLNINVYDQNRVFEIVRVSYLLANAKAVVSDFYPDSMIEGAMMNAVAFVEPKLIVSKCLQLLSDTNARNELAARGQKIMEKRDIRPILRAVLQD